MKEKFSNKDIGERLRDIRKRLGKTLEEMTDITGLSKSGISDMELGLKKPSSVYLYALNMEFNVNINWVLTGNGTTFSPDIEFNLNFGIDNNIIKELIFCLNYVGPVRYDILRHFDKIKTEHKKTIEEVKEKKSIQ